MTTPVHSVDSAVRLHPAALAAPGRYLWSREGQGYVGWGEWARVEVGVGPDRFRRAAAELSVRFQELEDAEGVIAFGSFTFDERSSGSVLVIPSTIVHIDEELTTIVSIGGTPDPAALDLPMPLPTDRIRYAGSSLPDHEWLSAVSETVDRIEAGQMDKVVLARDVKVWGEQSFDTGELARNLAASFPGCFTFLCEGLVGASPELLLERRDRSVRSIVLAGTSARGSDAASDAARGRALLGSRKDGHEHDLAVDSVREKLLPLTHTFETGRPELLRLTNVQHLATEIRGELRDRLTALELAGVLHPTAAVGGVPQAAALDAIRELEGMDRGRYAGPVGWVDAHGDGEWAIALRCGTFDGTAGRLFAGSGIVSGSKPLDELEETRLKLRAVQSALGGAVGSMAAAGRPGGRGDQVKESIR